MGLSRNGPVASGREVLFRRAAQAAFGLALVVLAVVLLLPSQAMPATGLWDKLEHAAAFAVLGLLGRAAFPRHAWPLALGLIAFGWACEALQVRVPGRTATLGDAVANAVGVLLAMALASAFCRWRRTRRTSRPRGP
jgi:VanZ family protein